ncbi:MAG: ABC transporter ATP-binding protein [Lachnospiraceae bacterium]|nr:ABC transporter ATP-binding protein [Lachnospiraceae bacterium]
MDLKCNDIKKAYGEGEARQEVLRGINCEIHSGEICVLLGTSGSGKSTLLNIIGGIETADSGCIDIGDECTENMSEKDLDKYRRNNLGFVFQFYNLIPNLTIKENIEVSAYLSKNPLEINELLKTLGLYDHKDKFPNQVSGGQQQRCAIGRALIKNPSVLLCDEPTGALDYKTSKEILELIEKVNEKYHNTIIIVTHNDAIKNMAHRVLKLRDGIIYKDIINETRTPAIELEW